MPKKMSGENSKAVAARERKNEKASAQKAVKEKAMEDAKWADDDKSLAKKQSKKEDAERKRLEALAKKKERDELLEAENQSATPKAKAAPAKVTQAQIKAEPATHLSAPLEENVNRVEIEG